MQTIKTHTNKYGRTFILKEKNGYYGIYQQGKVDNPRYKKDFGKTYEYLMQSGLTEANYAKYWKMHTED